MVEINLTLTNLVYDFLINHEEHYVTLKNCFPDLKFTLRGDMLKAIGPMKDIDAFQQNLALAIVQIENDKTLSNEEFRLTLSDGDRFVKTKTVRGDEPVLFGQFGLVIKPRTQNQKRLIERSAVNDLVFAVGPAGSGKTYMAVALAVRALKNREVKKIILTRPAVEAGENLGFLPGDLKEKIDPYLRPLYDALHDMLPASKIEAFIETDVIEIAPLAFMRGRTLDKAFVILDEAQNTTIAQMKMFLTRMGPDARFIVTGDETQIDLPRQHQSGLLHAIRLLDKVDGIGLVRFTEEDVVRHKLVKSIIKAYAKEKSKDDAVTKEN